MIKKSDIKEGLPFLINPSVVEQLGQNSTPFADNSAIPYVGKNGLSFIETVAVKRYEDLVENFQRTFNKTNFSLFDAAREAASSVYSIKELEKNDRIQLEDMAVRYVKQDFNIKDGEILFDVKLENFGSIQLPKTINYAPPKNNADAKFKYEMTDEVYKRRIINALTGGASKKGHYIFHLANEELNEINPALLGEYQKLMAANDMMYYMLPDDYAKMIVESNQGIHNAGLMEIHWSNDGKPIVYARGINFPSLIHEVVKGVMEVISFIALPDGREKQQYVIDQSDHIIGEMWDLRIGPYLWETFHSSLSPEDIPNKKMKLAELYQMNTEDFLEHVNKLLSDKINR